jgi:predicted nucleotidyltransferase
MNHDLAASLTGLLAGASTPIAAAYLFGSHARGEAKVDSDIDLAVLFVKPPGVGLGGACDELARHLDRALETNIDLVSLHTAPPDLVHRILRDGVLVHETDRSLRIAFEVRARNAYYDLLPHLQLYRRAATT